MWKCYTLELIWKTLTRTICSHLLIFKLLKNRPNLIPGEPVDTTICNNNKMQKYKVDTKSLVICSNLPLLLGVFCAGLPYLGGKGNVEFIRAVRGSHLFVFTFNPTIIPQCNLQTCKRNHLAYCRHMFPLWQRKWFFPHTPFPQTVLPLFLGKCSVMSFRTRRKCLNLTLYNIK